MASRRFDGKDDLASHFVLMNVGMTLSSVIVARKNRRGAPIRPANRMTALRRGRRFGRPAQQRGMPVSAATTVHASRARHRDEARCSIFH